MKKVKLALALGVIAIAVTSCKEEQQEKAQKSLDLYARYVDSVSAVAKEKAVENWKTIENGYAKLKTQAENSLANTNDKVKLQTSLDNSATKYEEFKTNILSTKEEMEANNSKITMYKALFGANFVNDDMKFNWVNKDNILSVYDNFVTTVKKNKNSYSREDWDEIKLVYEALDTRKNTVEKEGLTSSDNLKIAALKLKFAPMYSLGRMEAKSGRK